MVYCTKSDLDIYYRADYHSDDEKDRAIAFASAWIELQTGDVFEDEPSTAKVFSPKQDDRSLLWVTPRLRSLTSVEVRDDTASTWETLVITGIEVGTKGAYIRHIQGVFPQGTDTVRITGDWGWTAVPSIIREVCAEVAAMRLNQQIGQVQAERMAAGGSVKFNDDISLRKLLWKYTLHKFTGGGALHGRNASETPSEDLDEV